MEVRTPVGIQTQWRSERVDNQDFFLLLQFPGGKLRALEDLKGRYYSIARQLTIARAGKEENVSMYPVVKHPYNVELMRYPSNPECL